MLTAERATGRATEVQGETNAGPPMQCTKLPLEKIKYSLANFTIARTQTVLTRF